MKLKSLVVLVLACLGLGAYLYFGVQKPAEQKDSPDYNRLSQGKVDDITSFEIKTRESRFELKKQGNKWMLSKPIEDLASESKVLDFVSALKRFKQTRILFDEKALNEKKPDLSQFGLDQPRLTITYQEPSLSAPFSIIVGNQNPGMTNAYVRTSDGPTVYLASLDLDYLASQRAEDFREMKLTTVRYENFANFSLKANNREIKFAHENGEWKMTAPFTLPVENEAVRQLAEKISLIRANKFLDGTRPSSEPDIRVLVGFKEGFSDGRVKTGDQRPFGTEFRFWRKKKSRKTTRPEDAFDYFAQSDKTAYGQISQFHYDNLNKIPEDFVKKTFDDFVTTDVQKVTVKVPSQDVLTIEAIPNAGWKVLSGKKEQTGNNENIESQLKALRSMRAIRFLEKSKAPKVHSLEIELQLSDGRKRRFVFDLKKDIGSLYTQLAGENVKYLVSKEILNVKNWSFEHFTAAPPSQASSKAETKSEGKDAKEE